MKVLFVINTISMIYGGAQRMMAWVANAFAENKYEVILFTHKNIKGPYYLLDKRIKHIHADSISSVPIISPILKIRHIIKNEKPNVVISFMEDSNLYCVLAALRKKTPVVICERSDPYSTTFWKNKISNKLMFLADGGVFQLQRSADYFSNIRGPKVIIPNPIKKVSKCVTNSFEDRKDEICYVGRISIEQKRLDILLKAFIKVVKQFPSYKLVFYGDGPDKENLLNIAKESSIEKSVCFKGFKAKPYEEILNSKFFVLSSDYEGIPNSLMEAMNIGMTVISTDTSPGGARFLIKNNINGLIVPTNDYNELAKAIVYCINNPVHADEMGCNARKSMSRFRESKIKEMWFQYIYNFIKNEDRNNFYKTEI